MIEPITHDPLDPSTAPSNRITCVNINIEARKLDLEELRIVLDYRKFILSGVIAAIAIAAMPPLFQLATAFLEFVRSEERVRIDANNKAAERMAKQDEFQESYIKDFLNTALDQDIELRIRFAEYFASVSPDTSRSGWIDYRDRLQKHRDVVRQEILTLQTAAENASESPYGLGRLETKLYWAAKEIGYVSKNALLASTQIGVKSLTERLVRSNEQIEYEPVDLASLIAGVHVNGTETVRWRDGRVKVEQAPDDQAQRDRINTDDSKATPLVAPALH